MIAEEAEEPRADDRKTELDLKPTNGSFELVCRFRAHSPLMEGRDFNPGSNIGFGR